MNQRLLAPISVLVNLAILYYKCPNAFVNAQFWGEEGSVFFADAYHRGFQSVFSTCAGYFHLYPRLIYCLALVLHLPMELMAFVSPYAWLLMFALLQVYIWKRIGLESLQKFFISISIVFVPIQPEVLMNLTNVQWIMALFPVIIFSHPPQSRGWRISDAAVLFMSGFTGPNLLVFVALIGLLAIIKRKDFSKRWLLVLVGVVFISAIATLLSLVSYGSVDRTQGTFDPANPAFVKYIYMQYALLFTGKFAYDTPMPVIYLAALLIFAFSVYFLLRILRNRERSAFAILTFGGSVLFAITTIISYRHDPIVLHPHYGAARNFFLPALLCTWFILRLLTFNLRNNALASAFMLLLAYDTFSLFEVDKAVESSWSQYASKIKQAEMLSIPINPSGWYIFIDNRNQ